MATSAMTSNNMEDKIQHRSSIADAASLDKEGQVNLKSADKALAFVGSEVISIDEKTNKRIARKIDLHILPWLCGLYFLQYLDKGT